MESTTEYDAFVLREDNRAEVKRANVEKIAESIKQRNLLHLKPIQVNSQFEVIDGQHRLLAAKLLGVPIYYEVKEDLKPEDMLYLCKQTSWGTQDYLNYWVKNGKQEYVKFLSFLQELNMPLKLALVVLLPRGKNSMQKFQAGEFVFDEMRTKEDFEACKETIRTIEQYGSKGQHLKTGKFWKPLLQLVRSPSFDLKKWLDNLTRMTNLVTIKATEKEYLKCFLKIYNYKNREKITESSVEG